MSRCRGDQDDNGDDSSSSSSGMNGYMDMGPEMTTTLSPLPPCSSDDPNPNAHSTTYSKQPQPQPQYRRRKRPTGIPPPPPPSSRSPPRTPPRTPPRSRSPRLRRLLVVPQRSPQPLALRRIGEDTSRITAASNTTANTSSSSTSNTSHSRRGGDNPIHQQQQSQNQHQHQLPTINLTAASQHTEIEFYSTDDEGNEDGDESFENVTDDYDENEFGDDHSSLPPPVGGAGAGAGTGPVRRSQPVLLQRDLSVQSFASDAFSLPVGAQDDVSSLGCDYNYDHDVGGNINHNSNDDSGGVAAVMDDLSLLEKEGDSNTNKGGGGGGGDINYKEGTASFKPVLVVEMSDQSKMSPIPSSSTPRSTVDPARLLLAHKTLMMSPLASPMAILNKGPLSPSQRCLDHLPEVVNEQDELEDEDEKGGERQQQQVTKADDGSKRAHGENFEDDKEADDDEDDDNKSIGVTDLLGTITRSASGGRSTNNDDEDDGDDNITSRFHRSLFISRVSGLSRAKTASPTTTSTTPQARNRKSSSSNKSSSFAAAAAEDYDLLAQNLPPELDLNEARKYIAQLAEGIPDELTPVPITSPRGPVGHQFLRLRSISKSSASEFTEEIILEDDEDDDDADEQGNDVNDAVPRLDARLPKTPPNFQRISSRSSHTPRESLLSYDFTEVVEDDDEEGEDDENGNTTAAVVPRLDARLPKTPHQHFNRIPTRNNSKTPSTRTRESFLSYDFTEVVEDDDDDDEDDDEEEEEIIEEIVEEEEEVIIDEEEEEEAAVAPAVDELDTHTTTLPEMIRTAT